MPKEAVISTSKLNSYGTRVLTEGIDFEQYSKNPILLYMHARPWGSKQDTGVIGRIDNLRAEGDKLIGTPIFDEQDDFAKLVANKWEKGFLRMLSAGFDIIEASSDTQYLVAGQTGKTITRCKLEEVSIVDIGANEDALVLRHEGKVINLAESKEQDLEWLKLEKEQNIDNNKQNKKTMEKIALALGLGTNASESEVLAKISGLQRENNEAVELRRQIESQNNAAIEQAVTDAILCSKITADKKEHFVSMGKTMGLASLTQTLALLSTPQKPTEQMRTQTSTPGATPATYSKLSEVPVEELAKLRAENPSEYLRLGKAEYGKTFEIN